MILIINNNINKTILNLDMEYIKKDFATEQFSTICNILFLYLKKLNKKFEMIVTEDYFEKNKDKIISMLKKDIIGKDVYPHTDFDIYLHGSFLEEMGNSITGWAKEKYDYDNNYLLKFPYYENIQRDKRVNYFEIPWEYVKLKLEFYNPLLRLGKKNEEIKPVRVIYLNNLKLEEEEYRSNQKLNFKRVKTTIKFEFVPHDDFETTDSYVLPPERKVSLKITYIDKNEGEKTEKFLGFSYSLIVNINFIGYTLPIDTNLYKENNGVEVNDTKHTVGIIESSIGMFDLEELEDLKCNISGSGYKMTDGRTRKDRKEKIPTNKLRIELNKYQKIL